MAKVLRKEIMEDTGKSYLKDKVLDLLTNLRLEVDLLNESKTGPKRFKSSVKSWYPNQVRDDNKMMQEKLEKRAETTNV